MTGIVIIITSAIADSPERAVLTGFLCWLHGVLVSSRGSCSRVTHRSGSRRIGMTHIFYKTTQG